MNVWGPVIISIACGVVAHMMVAAYFYGRLIRTVEINTKRIDHLEVKVDQHDKFIAGLTAVGCPHPDCVFHYKPTED